jgi:hypothetical protein
VKYVELNGGGAAMTRSMRGFEAQRPRREAEAEVMAMAVECRSFALLLGGTKKEAAEGLKIPRRTLSEWSKRVIDGKEQALAPRGRPLQVSESELRESFSARLEKVGPSVGLEVLKDEFPAMARGEIREGIQRFRERYSLEHPIVVSELEWLRVGAVWAMDFTMARSPVDGGKVWILTVRDLASGMQILFKALESMDASVVVRELGLLIALHGAPIVIKMDNGSAFIAETTRKLFKREGVTILYSPPARPSYNGSIEATNGRLKDLSAWQAKRDGHPDAWTSDELERSRRLANGLSRPRGHGGKSAEAVWAARTPIGGLERQSLKNRVAEDLACMLRTWSRRHGEPPGPRARAALERTAIRRALVALGILLVSRRTIPLPFKSVFRAKIS